MNKLSCTHQTISPNSWIRNDSEYNDMNCMYGDDLTNYLPKTLPNPQQSTNSNYNNIPSSNNNVTTQSINKNYKQTRKRRRKTYNTNNNYNLSDSSSDIEYERESVHGTKKQRVIANDRERKRTQQLNEALSSLRRIVPTLPADKLSKYQTIKLATQYIEFLWTLLRKHENQMGMNELNFAFTEWRLKAELQMHHF